MNNKKVIIIGAGISGLCAGSYLQMNGYDTEIFELQKEKVILLTSAFTGLSALRLRTIFTVYGTNSLI